MSNELEDLVINGRELDRKLVADVLSPYVRLDNDVCSIRPLASWNQLNASEKVLLYLIARKGMKALGFDLGEEGATPNEVVRETGLKKGTVHPTLRKLRTDRMVDQANDRRYRVPNHAIEQIKDMLSRNEKGG